MKVMRFLGCFLGAILFLGGLSAGVAALVTWPGVLRYPATTSQGNVWDTPYREGNLSIWVFTPYVTPGGRVAVKIGVYGGLKVAIASVDITLGSRELHFQGHGKNWDTTIWKKNDLTSFARGSDTLELDADLPEDVTPGEVLPMRCQVTYLLAAEHTFSNGFSEKQGQASLEVPITVRSRWIALLLRTLQGGQALALFLLTFLFLRWLNGKLTDKSNAENDGDGRLAGIVCLFCLVIYVYAGYLFFVLPLLSAIGYSADWFCVVLVVLWIVGPFALFLRYPGKKPLTKKSEQSA
jgi:hypothetical protein